MWMAERKTVKRTGRRRSIEKAMRRQEAAGGIPDGPGALDEVSSADGKWDWALLGPDPDALPLAGVGLGGFEGIGRAMTQHAHCFGLLRLAFSEGTKEKLYYVFVHASDMDNLGKFPLSERGNNLIEPRMEQAIRKYADCHVKIDLESQKDCNVRFVIDALHNEVRGRPGSEIVSMSNYVVQEQAGTSSIPVVPPKLSAEKEQKSADRMAEEPRAEEAAEQEDEDAMSSASSFDVEQKDEERERMVEAMRGEERRGWKRELTRAEKEDEDAMSQASSFESAVSGMNSFTVAPGDQQSQQVDEQDQVENVGDDEVEQVQEQKMQVREQSSEQVEAQRVEEQQLADASGQDVSPAGESSQDPGQDLADETIVENAPDQTLGSNEEQDVGIHMADVAAETTTSMSGAPRTDSINDVALEKVGPEIADSTEGRPDQSNEAPRSDEPEAANVLEEQAEQPDTDKIEPEVEMAQSNASDAQPKATSMRSVVEEPQTKVEHTEWPAGVPRPSVATPVSDIAPLQASSSLPSLRKTVKLYAVGDVVEIFSEKEKTWLDGEVEEVTKESIRRDGFNVRAGSMKVTYRNGMRFKWIAPQQMEQYLRPSSRPRPPEPFVGDLYKETHAWWRTWWQKCYCELNKGFLIWWDSVEDARKGAKPSGSLYLLGMKLSVQAAVPDKSLGSTSVMKLCSTSSSGAISVFRRENGSDLSSWEEGLWEHAGYTEEAREYMRAREQRPEMHKEFLQVLARRGSARGKSP